MLRFVAVPLKIPKFFANSMLRIKIRDRCLFDPWIRDEKIRIWDEQAGSATLVKLGQVKGKIIRKILPLIAVSLENVKYFYNNIFAQNT